MNILSRFFSKPTDEWGGIPKGDIESITKDHIFDLLSRISNSYVNLDIVLLATTLSDKAKVTTIRHIGNTKKETIRGKGFFISTIYELISAKYSYEYYKMDLKNIISSAQDIWEVECIANSKLVMSDGKYSIEESEQLLVFGIVNGHVVVTSGIIRHIE